MKKSNRTATARTAKILGTAPSNRRGRQSQIFLAAIACAGAATAFSAISANAAIVPSASQLVAPWGANATSGGFTGYMNVSAFPTGGSTPPPPTLTASYLGNGAGTLYNQGLTGNSRSVAIDGAGDIFVAPYGGANNTNLYEIAAGSTLATVFSTSGNTNEIGMAFDPITGNLAVVNQNTNIIEYGSNGLPTETISVASTDSSAVLQGLAFDSSGNLYVTDNNHPSVEEVIKIATNGAQSVVASGFANQGLQGSLAVDKAGNVYVANYVTSGTTGGIYEFLAGTTGGTMATAYASLTGATMTYASQLAFDANGTLFMAGHDSTGYNIEEIGSGLSSAQVFIDSGYVTGSSIQQVFYNFAFEPVAVPEPASLGLLAVGALGLLARRRRRPA